MKKAVLVLGAVSCLAGSAAASGFETLFSAFSEPQVQAAPGKRAQAGDKASLRALCKEVDVAVDEGYGVSSHETRTVCAPDS